MAKKAEEQPAMSAFERRRLENIAANQKVLKELSTTAAKMAPPPKKPAPKPKTERASRSRSTVVKKEAPMPTRRSSRVAGLEVDGEGLKRKVDQAFEANRALEQAEKRIRVSGDQKLGDIAVEGKRWKYGDSMFTSLLRGAEPGVRTFDKDDIKETTDKDLKALRERMSGLELYNKWDPRPIKITAERIYTMNFHPTSEKPLVFAGDKMGNLGFFDASQTPGVKAEEDGEDEEEDGDRDPVISVLKPHSRTISSIYFPPTDATSVYTASYDSSIRRLDLEKQVSVEIYAPEDINDDEPLSAMDMAASDPNVVYFTTLSGGFLRHDIRAPGTTARWELSDKKIGGFSLNPVAPHLIATASLDRTLKIFDLRKIEGKGDLKHPALLGEHTSRLSTSHAAWSSAGTHVATSSYDDTVKIHHFPEARIWSPGHSLSDDDIEPATVIRHNNQTGRWVTILKPQWQRNPQDGVQKFVIGNMNRFVDVFSDRGEQLAQLGDDGSGEITAVPAVAVWHPSQEWVAGGTASGKMCLWMPGQGEKEEDDDEKENGVKDEDEDE